MTAALLLGLTVPVRHAAAQSASELGAWAGMMVTPIGALSPVAGGHGALAAGRSAWSFRYGRWRYDANDAVHDSGALTWMRSFGFARTQFSVTGGYQLIECPTCSSWFMGSADIQSSLVSWGHADSTGQRGLSADIDARVSIGGARYRGRDPVNAFSLGATLPIEILVPFFTSSAFHASVFPGLGFGRVASFGDTESGILPMIGGSVGWSVSRAFDVSIGTQRVILAGGATQVGAAVVWRRWARGGAQP